MKDTHYYPKRAEGTEQPWATPDTGIVETIRQYADTVGPDYMSQEGYFGSVDFNVVVKDVQARDAAGKELPAGIDQVVRDNAA